MHVLAGGQAEGSVPGLQPFLKAYVDGAPAAR